MPPATSTSAAASATVGMNSPCAFETRRSGGSRLAAGVMRGLAAASAVA